MVTLLASTMITNSAMTIRAMSAGVTGSLPRGSPLILPPGTAGVSTPEQESLQRVAHDRGRPVDLQDAHGVPYGEMLAAVLRAGAPLVGPHADPPAGRVDLAGHLGGAP